MINKGENEWLSYEGRLMLHSSQNSQVANAVIWSMGLGILQLTANLGRDIEGALFCSSLKHALTAVTLITSFFWPSHCSNFDYSLTALITITLITYSQ